MYMIAQDTPDPDADGVIGHGAEKLFRPSLRLSLSGRSPLAPFLATKGRHLRSTIVYYILNYNTVVKHGSRASSWRDTPFG